MKDVFKYRDWMNPYPPLNVTVNDESYEVTIDPTLLNKTGRK